MHKKRIVITGMGAVTPLGIGVQNYWRSLVNGQTGIGPLTRLERDYLPAAIGAEVKNFQPGDFMPPKLSRETDPFMQYALVAAQEALTDGEMAADPVRTGIIVGTALGGITTAAETQAQLTRTGSRRLSPHFVPKMLSNIAAAQIAIKYGWRGPSLTVNTACSSGTDAVGLAAQLLREGDADVMLAVGAESIFCSLMYAGLQAARALSTQVREPEKASRPFDRQRDGFVMGEGAGAVVLETLEHALKRGANIKAELLGYASFTDGYHITSPDPSGEGEILCMQKALEKAGLLPADIDYINAHGTSTKMGDQVETQAIKAVFGSRAYQIPVSSTKGATGHLMGAGGVTEMIACVKAIEEGVIPPTLNYEVPDPLCELDYVPNQPRKVQVKIAMSNSFGFGGQNASLIVGRYE